MLTRAARGALALLRVPTATGRAVIVLALAAWAVSAYAEIVELLAHDDDPGTRIMRATHQTELIEQDYRALLRLWPAAPDRRVARREGLGGADIDGRLQALV